ncbi:hypothetical protein ACM26V_09270 [Salipaludibacillus sp. HK11]|uniref:hypothetical protein n=1 Tax=Salipaludibacillus sp. HK11 TaxID=3394320 RepID=UPI0039FBB88F
MKRQLKGNEVKIIRTYFLEVDQNRLAEMLEYDSSYLSQNESRKNELASEKLSYRLLNLLERENFDVELILIFLQEKDRFLKNTKGRK